MFSRFIFFGFIGLLGEIIFTAGKDAILKKNYQLSGRTSLWMFPLYGLIAFFFPLIAHHVSSFSWWGRGIIYMIVFYIVEYVAGSLLRRFNACPWQYPSRLSIGGRIYLPFAPVWFLAGLSIEWIYPYVTRSL